MNMGDLPPAEAAQGRYAQATWHMGIDVAQCISTGITKGCRIRSVTGADAVRYDDDNPLVVQENPSL